MSSQLGVAWPAIAAAEHASQALRGRLDDNLKDQTSEDTTLVVFGSLGRREVTPGSDLDWVLLVDGIADPRHLDARLTIEDFLIAEKLKAPGPEAMFGELVFSHDLIHYIGGSGDTNANLTRRMLLLLESAPIGRPEAYKRTIHNILKRYIVEDFGWIHARNYMNVPRFLLNDIVRYWRTMAVDFAYKRRDRAGSGWALRTAKLRLSRKLTYAAGLLMCYSSALDEKISTIKPSEADATAPLDIVNHLFHCVGQTPLQNFAAFFVARPELANTAKLLFHTYDQFLMLLGDNEKRSHLKELLHDDVAGDDVYEHARDLGHNFQRALDSVFFNPDLPDMYRLTKMYGVF